MVAAADNAARGGGATGGSGVSADEDLQLPSGLIAILGKGRVLLDGSGHGGASLAGASGPPSAGAAERGRRTKRGRAVSAVGVVYEGEASPSFTKKRSPPSVASETQ